MTEEDSADYFKGEPLLAKFRATACHQSRVVTDDRQGMLNQINALRQKYLQNGGVVELPKPDYWGGFRLVPEMIEFYQGQRDTINDRIRFRRNTGVEEDETLSQGAFSGENGWIYERLEP